MKRTQRSERHIDWSAVRERLARAEVSNAVEREKEVLEERARRLARPLQESQQHDLIELTGFVLDGQQYAFETRYVCAIVRPGRITRVPGLPGWAVGLTSIRGEIVLVIDLRLLFGLPRTAVKESSRLVVCGAEAAEMALIVDDVERTMVVSADSIRGIPETVSGMGREFIRGVTEDRIFVLDGGALLADRRFLINQSSAEEE